MSSKEVKIQRLVADYGNNLKPRGELTIIAIDKNGNKKVYETPNVITYDARAVMANLLVGNLVEDNRIEFITLGSSSAAADRSNVTLGSPITGGQLTITSFTYPEEGQVEMTATLDFPDLNGETINEAGLVCGDGTTLFARQVFGDIVKSSALQLQFIWRIIYT